MRRVGGLTERGEERAGEDAETVQGDGDTSGGIAKHVTETSTNDS